MEEIIRGTRLYRSYAIFREDRNGLLTALEGTMYPNAVSGRKVLSSPVAISLLIQYCMPTDESTTVNHQHGDLNVALLRGHHCQLLVVYDAFEGHDGCSAAPSLT